MAHGESAKIICKVLSPILSVLGNFATFDVFVSGNSLNSRIASVVHIRSYGQLLTAAQYFRYTCRAILAIFSEFLLRFSTYMFNFLINDVRADTLALNSLDSEIKPFFLPFSE